MTKPAWTVEDARKIYNISSWSDGYFDVNQDGSVCTNLGQYGELSFQEIVHTAKSQGLDLPLLIRFPHILEDRVQRLKQAFKHAMQLHEVEAAYLPVYPIKVNQQKKVVEKILQAGVGLESGSKAELMAILSIVEANSLIVCNGYKDEEYLRLSMIGKALGHDVIIMIEKPNEVEPLIAICDELQLKPRLGLRLRLRSISQGNWQNTGGEKSKFGLVAAQVIDVVNRLQEAGFGDSIEVIHAHMGSQIANLQDMRKGLLEVTSWWRALCELGVSINTIDVGGGLGVDYEGTQSRQPCSMNYRLETYAQLVVELFAKMAKSINKPMPNIITESGRAMTAHHAVLLTQVIDQDSHNKPNQNIKTEHPMLTWFEKIKPEVNAHNALHYYETAQASLDECQQLFQDGQLNIVEKAQAESLYYELCQTIHASLCPTIKAHRALWDELNEKLATRYICNFSLFQSLPDIWAINQIFPIMPIDGLNQKPTHRGVIGDITCDSDGRIDHYVDGAGVESTLPLPKLEKDAVMAIFMVGAYQEILGDMHNLFGDTDSVHVVERGQEFALEEPLLGDSVSTVLKAVHYDASTMLRSYKHQIQASALSDHSKLRIEQSLASSLLGGTYLE